MDGPTFLPLPARAEAALALAMLPVGVVLGLLSAVGCVVLLVFAIPAFFLAVAGAVGWWAPAWCFAGVAALAWAAVGSIEIVSAFDWRPLPRVLAAIGLTAATLPFLW